LGLNHKALDSYAGNVSRDEEDAGVDAAVTDRIVWALSRVEESDFERVDPPADLWERIEASITTDPAMSPRQPLSREFPASTVVEYSIDANDIVTDVGRDWADFARDNDAPELVVPAPDRSLWTYFESPVGPLGSDGIRDLWWLLIERVRLLRRGAEVPFRCDAPHARRWFDLTITPEANGRVHFRSVLVFEQARAPVALLDLHSERDHGLPPVLVCGWCGQGRHGSLWIDIEELVVAARLLERESMPPISHGICASCREAMAAELLVPGRPGESTP